MKKKKLNLKAVGIAAAAVIALLLLKAVLAPASVGTLGDVTIPAGIYKMAQFQAYQTALGVADDDQASLTVANFLKEQIALDEDGEPAEYDADAEQTMVTVSDFVASETEAILRDYAAVESRFAALGGTLSDEDKAEADDYAAQVWESYGSLYYANGIKLKDIKQYEYNYYKAQQLLTLTYGLDGETPVGEDELLECLNEEGLYGSYVMVPLYNTSNYAFADEDQTAEMLEKAQAIVDEYTAQAMLRSTISNEIRLEDFTAALTDGLADVYGVLEMEYDPAESLEDDLSTDLFVAHELEGTFSEEDLATLTGLANGEAAAVQYGYYSLMIFLRADPLETQTVADWQDVLLSHLKSTELNDSLETYAAELTNGLKGFAMSCYSAKSITLSY